MGLAACGSSDSPVPSGAVASVDGTPISKATFDHWMTIAADSANADGTTTQRIPVPVPPDYAACVSYLKSTQAKLLTKGQKASTDAQLKSQCATEYQADKAQVVQFLVSAQWVVNEAANEGLSVTNKQVANEFATIRSQQFKTDAEYKTFLAQSGYSPADLLLRVKLQLLSTDLRNKVEKTQDDVSPAQIASYYNAHKSEFGTPRSVNLQLILTKTAAQAAAAKAAIQRGTPFATEAKAASIDVQTKANGGTIDGLVSGQEPAALNSAIFSSPLNTLEGPVKTPFGYYVFRVTKLIPATQRTLAQSSPQIKAALAAQGETSALNKWVASFTKRWTAKTDCATDYVVQDCKQYKAPKASSAAGTTGATGG